MTARGVALVVAWAAVVTGCTATPSDPPPSSTSTSSSARQRGPQDRDEDAVLAALRQIDLCEVLDAALAGIPALPPTAEPRARQPFACTVEGLADTVTAKAVSSIHRTRVSLPTRTMGGARAYVQEGDRCAVYLPVSFEMAIEFSLVFGDCQTAIRLAEASALVLANSGAARVEPRWDACTVLSEVLDTDADRSKLLGNGLDDCGDLSTTKRTTSITFADDHISQGEPRTAVISDRQVEIYEDDRTCDIYWRQGPFTSRFARTPDHQVLVVTDDCDRSMALAESAMDVLAGPPPAGPEAQWPLLYAPDEPDSPFLGACAYLDDVSNPERCEPYRDVPVPNDIVDSDNAHVMCAVGVDAVAKHFGADLRPVAVTDTGFPECYFVEPERLTEIVFAVSVRLTGPRDDEREVTVAGHRGYVSGVASYRLSAGENASVQLSVRPGPVTAADTPLPAGTDAKAEAVLADVLREYF